MTTDDNTYDVLDRDDAYDLKHGITHPKRKPAPEPMSQAEADWRDHWHEDRQARLSRPRSQR